MQFYEQGGYKSSAQLPFSSMGTFRWPMFVYFRILSVRKGQISILLVSLFELCVWDMLYKFSHLDLAAEFGG